MVVNFILGTIDPDILILLIVFLSVKRKTSPSDAVTVICIENDTAILVSVREMGKSSTVVPKTYS